MAGRGAFLTVITRHLFSRPRLLAFNQASLAAQSLIDYEPLIVKDEIGSGFDYARQLLIDMAVRATGDYVLILDDDDIMINGKGIESLRLATFGGPPAVIFKGWHGDDLGILPDNGHWRQAPQRGFIGSFDFITRRDVFKKHVTAESDRPDHNYSHDLAIIKSVYDEHGSKVVWLDSLICGVSRRNAGAGEND